MANISVESYTFTNNKGLLFKSGTHAEALKFAQDMNLEAEFTTGWIKNDWTTTPIRAHEDGLGAVFVNAVFNEGDRNYYYKLLGKEATDLLLRHHNVRAY